MIAKDIDKLKELGMFKRMVRGGAISLKVCYYYEIFNYFNKELEVNKNETDTILMSMTGTSEVFKCSEKTVQRAVKFMNTI